MAFPTVAAGLNAAVSGDEVWVAAGKYYENITLKTGVALYGGFLGTEAGRFQRNSQSNVTTLDGQYKGTVVVIPADATSATILDGFTIQRGEVDATTTTPSTGGGVYIAGGSPAITNNTITNCYAVQSRYVDSFGGGIYVAAGMPLISGNVIRYNYALNGAGIYAAGGLIRDNLITGNEAGPSYGANSRGAGLYVGPGAVVINNTIAQNRSLDVYGGGGGALCDGSMLLDNTFKENESLYGSAISCFNGATATRNLISSSATADVFSHVDIAGATFSNNLVLSSTGEAITMFSPGTYNGQETLISNNTLINATPQSNTAVVSVLRNGEKPMLANNLIVGWAKVSSFFTSSGTPPSVNKDHNDAFANADNTFSLPGPASGNISQDPLFVDPANGDYRLQTGSPCIDAGNDAYVASSDRDAAGAPRIYGAHVDIGAYEYGSPLYTMLDAAEVLRIAAGISIGTPANIARLDVVPQSPGLTILDATRIAQWLLN